MKTSFLLCASLGLLLSACQSGAETKTAEQTNTEQKKPEMKPAPPLPDASQYDGFIVYFQDNVTPADVLAELADKLNVNTKIQSTLATGGVLVQLIFADEDAKTVREKTQAFWQALHQHEDVIVAEPNLMLNITN